MPLWCHYDVSRMLLGCKTGNTKCCLCLQRLHWHHTGRHPGSNWKTRRGVYKIWVQPLENSQHMLYVKTLLFSWCACQIADSSLYTQCYFSKLGQLCKFTYIQAGKLTESVECRPCVWEIWSSVPKPMTYSYRIDTCHFRAWHSALIG